MFSVDIDGYVRAAGSGELALPFGVIAKQLVRDQPEFEAAFDYRQTQHKTGCKAALTLIETGLQ